ncbi:class I SAM-dependent methyltransferase [Spiribacter halobius]|uniref:SAM-dependent methyltransferase n=1 Tax=Sediminicurvatus halobius TaxID=2182432 RepID=A0A2U2N3D3_9GAMM|nr:class I SAM-dependent methyltransferase [Spiribacter halobius]PWG63686.1 SAM-dependent methyltransferase [Spiribacter halobius]UEX79824.1 class I SAM-dependent methyltransferase [Spiribacter halobius]
MTEADDRAHWEHIYATRSPEAVSWYQAEPTRSLELIEASGAGPHSALVDVGAGASRLVDCLLARGWQDITVLDFSVTALEAAQCRLGEPAAAVNWLVADVREYRPERPFDLWHDRAVFHFLTDAADREAYRRSLEAALRPGGHVVMATFGPDGPERCSGLPVVRYDAEALTAALGSGFRLLEERAEQHRTPSGVTQAFRYFLLRREGA